MLFASLVSEVYRIIKDEMIEGMELNKPAPALLDNDKLYFNQGSSIQDTIKVLTDGKPIIINYLFSDGLLILQELKRYLTVQLPNKSFQEQRNYRSAYHGLSNLVLVNIKDHKLVPEKSPFIGWLKQIYPDHLDFYLTFPQIQGLNSSWQWFKNGVSIPVLRNKIHPFYGTYFPTRFEHLILLDNWLKHYKGAKKTALDVGIGSGVLSFLLVEHGFQKVYGTDSNVNAIVGLIEFMGNTKLSRKIELDFGHLFGKWCKPSELIVFNPPWIPATKHIENLDEAIYYPETLFPEFFEGAERRLIENGVVLVIFSNIAVITGVTTHHPIAHELEFGKRFQLKRCFKKKVKAASSKSVRDQFWREEEEVELWVLVKRSSIL